MKAFILALMSFAVIQTAGWAETYTVQPEASKVEWTASKITGKHNGLISITSGTIEFDGDTFTGGEATIDTTSLTVEDLTGGGKDKLTEHLKSADFFDVEEYPTATLKITDVEATGDNTYDVTADLTIKDVTHPIEFEAVVEKTADGAEATAELKIDRTKYDIRYGSGKFFENLGDKTIHDDFTLDVSVQAS